MCFSQRRRRRRRALAHSRPPPPPPTTHTHTLKQFQAVAGEVFGPGALVFGLPKESPATDALTRALLKLTESGLTAELKRRWFVDRAAW